MYRRSLRLSLSSCATGHGIPGFMDASLKKALLNNELLNKALLNTALRNKAFRNKAFRNKAFRNKAPRHFYHPLNSLAEVKGFTYGS